MGLNALKFKVFCVKRISLKPFVIYLKKSSKGVVSVKMPLNSLILKVIMKRQSFVRKNIVII